MNLQEAFDAGFDAVKAYVDGALGEFEKRLSLVESREPLRGEKGDTGERGLPGVRGNDGVDGKDGATGERGLQGEPGISGKDGAAGRDGRDGIQGAAGKDGLNGKDGRDGIDGKDGAAGLNGKDGFGLEDFNAHLEDGGRVLVLAFSAGDTKKEFRLNTGMFVYRGVFKDGEAYEQGDLVTWAGSLWYAHAETNEKPEASTKWQLAAKKGRDGKDGQQGLKGDIGPQGPPGLDRR